MTDRDLLPPLDDADLRAFLDRCLSDVRVPDRLHASALADGRRLRTRRRVGQVTGGLLAAAAACTVVVVAIGGGGQGTAGPGYAGNPSPTTAPSPTATPTPTSVLTPTPAAEGPQPQSTGDNPPSGWWDVPSRRMLTVLRDVLPDGVTVTESERHVEGTTEKTMAIGSLSGLLTGPTGPGTFQVLLFPPDPSDRIRCEAYMTTCDPVLDTSGATIGRVTTAEEGGTTYYEVMLLGPDGGALYVYVGDSSGEKPGYEAPSAEAPPLSTDQLLDLAQDPAWTDYDPED